MRLYLSILSVELLNIVRPADPLLMYLGHQTGPAVVITQVQPVRLELNTKARSEGSHIIKYHITSPISI